MLVRVSLFHCFLTSPHISFAVMLYSGYVTSYYDIPHFASGGLDQALNDKMRYDTLSRLSYSFNHIGSATYQVTVLPTK